MPAAWAAWMSRRSSPTYSTREGATPICSHRVCHNPSSYAVARASPRSGLQVHGAIGYTAELDLSLWLVGIRAMVSAWGTPAAHRARLLDALLHDRVEGRTG